MATELLKPLNEYIVSTGLRVRGTFLDKSAQFSAAFDDKSPKLWVLIGLVGSESWSAFSGSAEASDGAPHPMDRWSLRLLNECADRTGGLALEANDRRIPLQRLASMAEGIGHSPLGLLIHPRYGLWHAYRGALIYPKDHAFFNGASQVSATEMPLSNTCDVCVDKPCLNGCPVNAFDSSGFQINNCRDYLQQPAGQHCLSQGCQARGACPVGHDYRYLEPQRRFHIQAFAKAIGGITQTP